MKLKWKTVNPHTGMNMEEDAPLTSIATGGIDLTPHKKKKKGIYDGRTKGYKEHRSKLEAARLRRQETLAKKKSDFIEQIVEATKWKKGDGRPRGASHIENVRFWDLSDEELRYIMKDAGEAMKANPTARKATSGPGNWADQVNDAHTVLGWRKKKSINVK